MWIRISGIKKICSKRHKIKYLQVLHQVCSSYSLPFGICFPLWCLHVSEADSILQKFWKQNKGSTFLKKIIEDFQNWTWGKSFSVFHAYLGTRERSFCFQKVCLPRSEEWVVWEFGCRQKYDFWFCANTNSNRTYILGFLFTLLFHFCWTFLLGFHFSLIQLCNWNVFEHNWFRRLHSSIGVRKNNMKEFIGQTNNAWV